MKEKSNLEIEPVELKKKMDNGEKDFFPLNVRIPEKCTNLGGFL
jgi:hypothetical protein